MSSQNYWADNLRILQWMISDVKAYCDRNGLEKMSTKRLIGQIKSAHSGVESFRKQENGILRRGLSGVGFRK